MGGTANAWRAIINDGDHAGVIENTPGRTFRSAPAWHFLSVDRIFRQLRKTRGYFCDWFMLCNEPAVSGAALASVPALPFSVLSKRSSSGAAGWNVRVLGPAEVLR